MKSDLWRMDIPSTHPISIGFSHTNMNSQAENPVVLSFSAKIIDGDRDGEEAKAKVVVQDVKDQLRQEYMDFRETKASDRNVQLKVPVPAREQILNSAQWISKLVSETRFFSASKVFQNASSYYMRKYAYMVVDRSFKMLNTVRTEWANPLSLGSTWRSPKYNSSLSNSLRAFSSKHQTGDACDVQIIQKTLSQENWRVQLIAACTKGLAKLGSGYQYLVHGENSQAHCHLEYDK